MRSTLNGAIITERSYYPTKTYLAGFTYISLFPFSMCNQYRRHNLKLTIYAIIKPIYHVCPNTDHEVSHSKFKSNMNSNVKLTIILLLFLLCIRHISFQLIIAPTLRIV